MNYAETLLAKNLIRTGLFLRIFLDPVPLNFGNVELILSNKGFHFVVHL